MTKKFQSITNKLAPVISLFGFVILWLFLSEGGIVPEYMLPSPVEVGRTFINDFPILMEHLRVTLKEAILGLLIGTGLGFVFSVLMDRFTFLYKYSYILFYQIQSFLHRRLYTIMHFSTDCMHLYGIDLTAGGSSYGSAESKKGGILCLMLMKFSRR